jgi:hypothetical protein
MQVLFELEGRYGHERLSEGGLKVLNSPQVTKFTLQYTSNDMLYFTYSLIYYPSRTSAFLLWMSFLLAFCRFILHWIFTCKPLQKW